ncbi:MAG TPA: Ig-like domain-containing protein [Gemmatimonadaceae bacterium]|nr:Ig-like domain-containing protein [Gemmatimonadaceae bacterium]
MSTHTDTSFRIHAARARRFVRLLLSPFAALALLVAIACSDSDPSSVTQPVPVATVTVSPLTQTLAVGATATLTAALADAAGKPITGRPITWVSNRPAVATVSASGVITAVTEGVAQIDATSEGKYGTANVVVTRAPVARLEITPATMSLAEGQTGELSTTAYDANGGILVGRAVTWSSSDVTIAPIYANGQVLGIRPGTVTITAEGEGKTATVQVTVAGQPVATVSVSPLPSGLETGDVFTLTAVAKDLQGRVLNGRTIAWSTSNAAVATISPNGQVIVRAPGTVTLTATSEGKTGSATGVADAPPSSDLLYQRTTPLSNELFTLHLASTGNAPAKINAGNVSHQPSMSADGTRIAFFVSMTAGNGEVVEDIFAVDRGGTNMKRLTTTPGVDNAPAWAPVPGMNVIAYQRLDPATGRSDIWVMDSNGANQRNLTADMPIDLSRGEPAWSPDGEWIAFTSSRWTAGPGRGSIWIMRWDGSEKRQLTLNPGNGFDLSPSWSPDGQRIAFQRGGISIVAVATGAVTNLGLPGMSLQPSWSPDGRHIAFAWQPLEPGAGDLQLYTVRADGTGMRLRTTNPAWGGGVSPTWIAR